MKKSSLNHCYKLIWNHIQHTWVAVAEHVKNKGKKSHLVNPPAKKSNNTVFSLHRNAKLSLMLLSAISGLGISHSVNAQWEGVVNQHGQASYQYNGDHLDVNVHSHQLIANAHSLDIAQHESVNIQQLSAQDTALFRSIGPGATEIFGSLTANGHVFLINQNGVLFGQGAQVDVGSLVTSSMDISNSDFLEGKYQFNANGGTGSVVNQGVIKVADGGYVVLLGHEVENNGSVTANQGSVVMASAEHAVLDFYGNGLVKAKLSGDALNAVVNQAGNVHADGGAVQLATHSRSSAVNMTGLVQANTLVKRDGVIRLEGGDHAKVSVSGKLNATGQAADTKGGTVEVTGEQVALFDGATIDVSGQAGGGTALVGGDYQGANSQVYNARTTYIDQGASIKADAYVNGDGGKAIVWADQITRYYGNISAKGGIESGNGGMVEVSGKRVLDFIGSVDVSATQGKGGTVLLDPDNIVLENAIRTAPVNNPDGTPDLAFTDPPASGTLSIQISDVTGYSELFLQAGYNITIKDDITMATDNSIRLEANNHIRAIGKVTTSGTGNISLIADADKNNSGNLYIYRGVSARQGDITLSGANIIGTTNGHIVTHGAVGQNSGNVSLSASGDISLQGNIAANGRNSSSGVDGSDAGTVNLTAGGEITTGNISAYGGHGGTGDTAGGDAGTITINSTGAGDINVGTLNARNGMARGTGAGGATGSINITNTSGNIDTKNLYVQGNVNGNAGGINLTATNGYITATGNIYAQGGSTAAGSAAAGGNGGNITMNASGDVTVIGRVYAQGATPRNGNTAAGGDGGNVNISGANLSFNNVIYAYGGTGRGLNQAGGDAGNIALNATGAISANNVYAYGGNGGTGTGSNANAGDAGNITIASTGAGDIATNYVNARNGAARGIGAGGAAGSINITNSEGNINTRNLDAFGNLNGHGGDINVAATNGDVTVTGRVYSYGGSVNNGHTLAGRNAGDITISGTNTTITNRVNANGNTAKGSNQAGGDAGTVNISAANALAVRDVYSRTGRATDAGAGGSVGGVTLSGGTVTATSTISTSGERNGDAGNINITSSTGDTNLSNVYASGGGSNTNTTGNNAGNIAINSAGALVTTNVYANGSAGNGLNQDGGNAGVINVDAAGAITMNAVNASGGAGGNATGSNANGGNAGAIDIRSTSAGDININNNLVMHAGAARGAGNAGDAGSVTIKNDDGSIATRNIYAEGYNHGDGSHVTLDAEGTGNVTVTGQIRAYGDVNATGDRTGTDGGDVVIKGVNVTVTSTVNTNGGRGMGVNQIGGDAGDVTINAAGAISTQVISANGGNAGAGTGSNAAGGDAGTISLTSTGAGDITTTNINARTGYTRGSVTATGAGSVNIQNDNGAITTGNITTRAQRRGYGGDVTAVTTGGDITVGTVDARASNVAASNGGDVVLATTTGDATVSNIRTGGRWLVYSGDPRNDTIGTFKSTADFKQYNTNYGEALLNGGNGFVYRYAPMITNTLIGSASKVYDGNTTVTSIAGLTFNQGAAIDGDVVTLSPFTSATYDNKNAGTGKTVTSNTITVTGATNGTTQVYGYQTSAATGNVGEITQRAITVSAVTDTKTYDGNTSSVGLPTVTSGSLVAGDTASFTQTFDNKNAGTGKTLSASGTIADGNGGNNYAVTYIDDNTGVINPKTITVTANAGQSKNVFAPDPATLTYSVNGLVSGDNLTGTLTRAPGEAVGSYIINQGTLNAGGNYTINYIGDNFSILANTTSENTESLNPRNSAGLGQLLSVDASPQQFVAVFNVGATAAGGDLDTQNTCQTNEDKSMLNPNTSLMLNFGITLPEGVEEYCI